MLYGTYKILLAAEIHKLVYSLNIAENVNKLDEHTKITACW